MPTLTLHRVTIPLDDQISLRIRDVMRRTGFEQPEALALDRLLRPDDVVLELGTGCGFLAVYCAQRCARVVTVEADERMRGTSAAVFAANAGKSIVQHWGAVTRTGERRALHADKDFWATRTSELDPKKPGPVVEGLALGDLLNGYEPTVLVVDIEGGERELTGEPLPKTVRAVVIETHDGSDDVVAEWLAAEGFQREATERVSTWVRF